MVNCTDCDLQLDVPADVQEGEIISCPACGAEHEYKNGKIIPLVMTGYDWGE